jgi:hypothetical protein
MKQMIRALPMALILAGVTLSAASFAGSLYGDVVLKNCSDIAIEIRDLIHANTESPCAGDLDVASAHVESAQISLNHHKFNRALKSIDYAIRELREISYARAYCAPLAPDSKRILAELIRAKSEIEGDVIIIEAK